MGFIACRLNPRWFVRNATEADSQVVHTTRSLVKPAACLGALQV
jgi:hypothetical protein